MNVKRAITPHIIVADQPTESDLRDLASEGFAGVVNLRNDGEPEQPLSTAAEGEEVRGLGMDYLHYGVGGQPLSPGGVGAVCDFLERHASGKVLVHCRKGARAQALVLIQQAKLNGWQPDEALDKGRAIGLGLEGSMRTLVENYLREHAEQD